MYIGLHIKYPLFLSDFNEIWIFSTVFQKLLRYQIKWKFVQSEPKCSMRTEGRTDGLTDGQTGIKKLLVAFAILWTHLTTVCHETRDNLILCRWGQSAHLFRLIIRLVHRFDATNYCENFEYMYHSSSAWRQPCLLTQNHRPSPSRFLRKLYFPLNFYISVTQFYRTKKKRFRRRRYGQTCSTNKASCFAM